MLTVNDAAEKLGITTQTVRQQILAGRLKARKVGHMWIVDAHDLRRYRRNNLGKPGRKRAAHQ